MKSTLSAAFSLLFLLQRGTLVAACGETLADGEIQFYEDTNYGGACTSTSIYYYRQFMINRMGNSIQSNKSFKYNLPTGVMVTLQGINDCCDDGNSYCKGAYDTDDYSPEMIDDYDYYNTYKERMNTVDLAGSGQVPDLSPYFQIDAIKTNKCGNDSNGGPFYIMGLNTLSWRNYLTEYGFFTVFDGEGYTGARKNIVPFDFARGTGSTDLGEWRNVIGSIYWPNLGQAMTVTFYDNADMETTSYQIKTYGSEAEEGTVGVEDLGKHGQDIAAWTWDFLYPYATSYTSTDDQVYSTEEASLEWSIYGIFDFYNEFDYEQSVQMEALHGNEYSSTTTTAYSESFAWGEGFQLTWTPAKATGGVTAGVTFMATETSSFEQYRSHTSTEEFTYSATDTFYVPAKSHYISTLAYNFMELATSTTVNETRWYDEYMTNGVEDPNVTYCGYSTYRLEDQFTVSTYGSSYSDRVITSEIVEVFNAIDYEDFEDGWGMYKAGSNASLATTGISDMGGTAVKIVGRDSGSDIVSEWFTNMTAYSTLELTFDYQTGNWTYPGREFRLYAKLGKGSDWEVLHTWTQGSEEDFMDEVSSSADITFSTYEVDDVKLLFKVMDSDSYADYDSEDDDVLWLDNIILYHF